MGSRPFGHSEGSALQVHKTSCDSEGYGQSLWGVSPLHGRSSLTGQSSKRVERAPDQRGRVTLSHWLGGAWTRQCPCLTVGGSTAGPARCTGHPVNTLRARHPPRRCPPPCDIPSGCCSFTGPWTVTRSSLRMLRRVAAFCRPLRPVLLLVSFPRSRSPVVGALGLC